MEISMEHKRERDEIEDIIHGKKLKVEEIETGNIDDVMTYIHPFGFSHLGTDLLKMKSKRDSSVLVVEAFQFNENVNDEYPHLDLANHKISKHSPIGKMIDTESPSGKKYLYMFYDFRAVLPHLGEYMGLYERREHLGMKEIKECSDDSESEDIFGNAAPKLSDISLTDYIKRFEDLGRAIPCSAVKFIMFKLMRAAYILIKNNKMIKRSQAIEVIVINERLIVPFWFMAPEMKTTAKVHSATSIMWSVGCIFAQLALVKQLIPVQSRIIHHPLVFSMFGLSEEQAGLWTRQGIVPPMPNMPNLCEQGADLLFSLLKYDSKNRISFKAALRHPYFDDVDEWASTDADLEL